MVPLPLLAVIIAAVAVVVHRPWAAAAVSQVFRLSFDPYSTTAPTPSHSRLIFV